MALSTQFREISVKQPCLKNKDFKTHWSQKKLDSGHLYWQYYQEY